MSKARKTPTKVGFRRPPADSQFQKGRSGNPAGRPKAAKNLATQFMDEVSATIPITENGQPRKISKLAAVIKQQVAKGAGGDARAAQQILDRVTAIEARLNENGIQAVLFTDADRQGIETIFARLAPQGNEFGE